MFILILIILFLIAAAVLYWYVQRMRNKGRGLPVLMYHKIISEGPPDYLSLSREMLEKQFNYLKTNGYNTISLSELQAHITGGAALPPKPCLITFDDGYRDNYTLMFPLLQQYGLKANIFLVAGFLEGGNKKAKDEFLQIDEIKQMAENNVEFGLHSYEHDSYKRLSLNEIEADINKCIKTFEKLKINYVPCLAYTYGAFPKRDKLKKMALFHLFGRLGISMAFRIGNRLNRLPLSDKYQIQRLDVRGNEPFEQFEKSLMFGKKLV